MVDFGAVGNGVVDDTKAVQAAAKMATSAGVYFFCMFIVFFLILSYQGVLYFPSGAFLVTSTITLVTSVPYEVCSLQLSSSPLFSSLHTLAYSLI